MISGLVVVEFCVSKASCKTRLRRTFKIHVRTQNLTCNQNKNIGAQLKWLCDLAEAEA